MWWTRALTPFRRWRGQLRVEKFHQDLEKRNINMPMAEAGPHRRHMIRPARIPPKEGTTTTRSTFPSHLGAPLPHYALGGYCAVHCTGNLPVDTDPTPVPFLRLRQVLPSRYNRRAVSGRVPAPSSPRSSTYSITLAPRHVVNPSSSANRDSAEAILPRYPNPPTFAAYSTVPHMACRQRLLRITTQ